jgi:hypothetical protein
MKEYQIKYSESNILVTPKGCYIMSVLANPTGAGIGAVVLYNGFNDSAVEKVAFHVGSNIGQAVALNIPFFFNKGLYITKTAAIANFTVQYRVVNL